MIIVNQDKNNILNFSNLQNVRIEPYGTHEKGKKIYKIFAGNFEGYATKLGTYETEERAKEVLQEIWDFYETAKRYECSSNISVTIFLGKKFTYEMPKE